MPSAAHTVMASETLFDIVGREARRLEQVMRDDLARALDGADPYLAEILEYALFGGGKRIRPLLTVVSARICGDQDERAYLLGAAFEYLHVATLVHDDVIDRAAQRRNRAATWRKYGLQGAILAGDWLHARAMALVGELAGGEGLQVFSQATQAMVDGEFLQLRWQGDPAILEETYFAIIDRKTSRLLSAVCEIGAIFAGAPDRPRQALARYGRALGTAFQVKDDLLDYQGDASRTGKAVGQDFVEGKMTLPLIRARQRLGGEAEALLRRCLQEDDSARRRSLARITELIRRGDGFRSAAATAARWVEEARAALECFDSPGQAAYRKMLEELAEYVLERQR